MNIFTYISPGEWRLGRININAVVEQRGSWILRGQMF